MAIRTALVGSILGTAAALEGGVVKLAWSDCGDSSTHGHITSLSPDTLTLGSKTSLAGKGKVDEAIDSATYKVDAKAAGITVFSHNGDACKPETIKLPAGTGEIDLKGFSCPISVGDVELDLDVSLSAAIPSSLARVTIDLTAAASSGDKALCVQIKTSPGMGTDTEDSDMYIPRGLRIENSTDAEIEIARSMQFEKDFENGDYQSDLDVVRGMANCNQKCSNWCWATSATMAASAFGGGSQCVAEEEKVAGREFHTTCDDSCSSKCNKGGTFGEITDGIKYLSGHSYSSGGSLSQQSLDSALRHGPVVIGVQWTLGGGHAITISGGSGGKYTGHDPEGYAINTNYAGLTTYKPPYAHGRYTGKWFASAYTKSGEATIVV